MPDVRFLMRFLMRFRVRSRMRFLMRFLMRVLSCAPGRRPINKDPYVERVARLVD